MKALTEEKESIPIRPGAAKPCKPPIGQSPDALEYFQGKLSIFRGIPSCRISPPDNTSASLIA
jgi:hypothetical protein